MLLLLIAILLAGLVGYAAGFGLARYVLDQLHVADAAVLHFDAVLLLATVGTVSLASMLAAAFPAWKASLVEPAEALVAL